MKSLSNETPKEFITRIRIESACTMLVSTNLSIQQIATNCGYTEDTAFRKTFNQIMEMTPAQYRQWMAQRTSGSVSGSTKNYHPFQKNELFSDYSINIFDLNF